MIQLSNLGFLSLTHKFNFKTVMDFDFSLMKELIFNLHCYTIIKRQENICGNRVKLCHRLPKYTNKTILILNSKKKKLCWSQKIKLLLCLNSYVPLLHQSYHQFSKISFSKQNAVKNLGFETDITVFIIITHNETKQASMITVEELSRKNIWIGRRSHTWQERDRDCKTQ